MYLQVGLSRAVAGLAPVCMLIIAVMVIITHVLWPAARVICRDVLLTALSPVPKVRLDVPPRIAVRWHALLGVACAARSHAVLPVSDVSP